MNIQTVEYRKLLTHGNYANTTVGMTAGVDPNEHPVDALSKLQRIVDEQVALISRTKDESATLQERKCRLEGEIDALNRRCEIAKNHIAALNAVLAANGLAPVDTTWPDDMPF